MNAGKHRIGQLALVVSNLDQSTLFYREVFGMSAVFGTSAFRGEQVSEVQGMENPACSASWLIDDRPLFQLELFQYEHPCSKPIPGQARVSDIGYNRLIIAVRSIEQTLGKVDAFHCEHWSLDGSGIAGIPPHAMVRDPDGILLELVEMPERILDQRPARMLGLGITVKDLATTAEDMCEGFGFEETGDLFHHNLLWQEAGTLENSRTFRLADMFLVASTYRDSRPRPVDYQLCDIGVMNFALCFPSLEDFQACYTRGFGMGMRSNCKPITSGDKACMVYHNDRQGFSVEMIYISEPLWGLYGFARPSWRDRLINALMELKARIQYRPTPKPTA